MKIQLLSDLHLEFFPLGYRPDHMLTDADVLVIAGDLAKGRKSVEEALAFFADHYPNVIYVPGNHEYYGKTIRELDNLKLPTNVHFLNPGSVTIDAVSFIGCTLWSDFHNNEVAEQLARKFITDFKVIKGFDTNYCKELHRDHKSFLANAVDAAGKKVIVTHFLPSLSLVHPKWKVDPTTLVLNNYFAPDCDDIISKLTNTTYWFFGHTHDSIDKTIENTRFICNPYGYYAREENPNFDPRLIV